MELLALTLITAGLLVAARTPRTNHLARHRAGFTVADIEARLATEARTYVPLNGW